MTIQERAAEPEPPSEPADAVEQMKHVRQPPSQHMPTRPIHDRHQVKEASAHRDIGDVGAPDRIGPVDRHVLEQIRVDPVLGMRITGAWRPVDRLKPHQAHQTTGPAATDAHTLKAQMTRPSGGLRRTDASGTTHQCAALAQGSPHSRPWAYNRARIARSIANGIDGSTQPRVRARHHRPALGPAHRPDPLDKKSRSTVNSPILA